MKINHNTLNYYKILLKLLDGKQNDIGNTMQKEKSDTSNKREMSNSNITKPESNEILKLLGKLNENDRKLLVSNLIRFNLPLDTKKIKLLVSYLHNKAGENNNELIKSFLLLLKNKIPINKSLLDGIGNNLKQEQSLSKKLNKLININQLKNNSITKETESIQKGNNSEKSAILNTKSSTASKLSIKHTTEKENTLSTIIKQVIINPSSSEETLLEQLKAYPERLSKSIQLLQEQSGNNEQKVIQQLIGQQLINHQDKNLLLNLEIPIFFPQYKKLIPAYLNIKRDNNNQSKNKDSIKNYKINFIISLEKCGIIKAETYISTGRIKISFTCNEEKTVELIKSRFNNLKENLQDIGISVEKPTINYSNINSEDINNVLSGNIGIDHNKIDNFMHIDIKV